MIVDPCESGEAQLITQEEQSIIERWLTSPKYSSDLNIIDNDGNIVATYCEKFISTEWLIYDDRYNGVTFTFENNGPYAKEHCYYKA